MRKESCIWSTGKCRVKGEMADCVSFAKKDEINSAPVPT